MYNRHTLAAVEQDSRVVTGPLVPLRRPHEYRNPACSQPVRDVREPPIDALGQIGAQQEVVRRIAQERQLRQHHQARAIGLGGR